MTETKKPRRKAKLIAAKDVHAKWQKDPTYNEAYDALEEEFAIMATLIRARTQACLSQTEVAKRMRTTQPAVARLEGGGHRASLKTLRSYAEATGHRIKIVLEPLPAKAMRASGSR